MKLNTKTLKAFVSAAGLVAFCRPVSVLAQQTNPPTATPIQHVVVIFQENVSFDHYFATYPNAANLAGETPFNVRQGLPFNPPTVNGLTGALLTANPNSTQPFRLTPALNYTCDQDHEYLAEQQSFDSGLMDKFPEFTGTGGGAAGSCPDAGKGTGLVMGYYDGNTVTAIWNYAQYFAMNDNSFGTNFGPSTPGAINLISGNTGTVDSAHTLGNLAGVVVGLADISDADAFYDDCSNPNTRFGMSGPNVGDMLNTAGVTWGWFEGGFTPTATSTAGVATCGASTKNIGGSTQADYSPHHQPFQYYASTSNPHHLPPTSTSMIGLTDQANHQYDLTSFWAAVYAHNMPAVSFVKAKRSQDGHAGYSSPFDEQNFLVTTLNNLQLTPEWESTAVIIAYDDSDGWYDHVPPPIVNQSATSEDGYTGKGLCGAGTNPLGGIQGRCGYGPRLPLLVISPYAKSDFVDHTTTDQSSVLRFIEDNWLGGKRIGGGSFDALAGPINGMFNFTGNAKTPRLILDPSTGAKLGFSPSDFFSARRTQQ